MNRAELISKISEKSELTKKDSEKALNGFLDAVIEAVAQGDKVQLVGFGTFESRQRKERKGRDPRSGEEITIPATNSPGFKAGKLFKEALNK